MTRSFSSSFIIELCLQGYRKESVVSLGGSGTRCCLFGSQDRYFQVRTKAGSKVRLPWQQGPVLFYFKIPGEPMEDVMGEVIQCIALCCCGQTPDRDERSCRSGYGLCCTACISRCMHRMEPCCTLALERLSESLF